MLYLVWNCLEYSEKHGHVGVGNVDVQDNQTFCAIKTWNMGADRARSSVDDGSGDHTRMSR